MKKVLKFIVGVMSLITLFSCDNGNVLKDKNGNSYNIKSIVQKVYQNENYEDTCVSFYDDFYNYYVFEVGRVTNVPLDLPVVYYYNGLGEIEREFSVTISNASSIKQETTKVTSKTVNWQNATTLNFKGEFGFEKAGIKANIETGFSNSFSKCSSTASSCSESFSRCVENATANQEKITIKFSPNTASEGSYRYSLLGDLKLFATIIKDRKTNDYYSDISSELYQYKYMFEYSKDGEFELNINGKVDFDLSKIKDLKEPTTYYNLYPAIKKEYNSAEEEYIVPSAFATLGDESLRNQRISLDISDYYTNYFDDKYTKMKISLSFKIKQDKCDIDTYFYIGQYDNREDSYANKHFTSSNCSYEKTFNSSDFKATKKIYFIFRNENFMNTCYIAQLSINIEIFVQI